MAKGAERVEQLVKQLRADVGREKPPEAAFMAHQITEAWANAQPGLADLRRAALRQAQATGWTNADLAALLGVSRQRIHQLVESPTTTRGPRPRDRKKGSK
jgi:DNA-directed RNA polymerase specialized sigma24 family protein